MKIVIIIRKGALVVSELIRGFTPSSTEITIFVVVVVAFVAVLIAYSTATRRRERRRRIVMSERRYRGQLEELGLSKSDEECLETLYRFWQPERKYLLLQNHTVFNDCAERAMADGAIGEGQVSALRVRLGFSGQPVGAELESSAEIPAGSGVVLADSHDRMIRARVMEPTPSSFRVSTDEDAPRLTTGSLVEVIYQNGTGVYRFDASVLANPPGEMELSHAERVERVQRRRYYRGKVRLPVYVKLAAEQERPEPTWFIDIGGGGASFFAPDDRYQRGESVEMTFHPDSQQAIHLVGRIVRESRGGKVVHVKFTDVAPSTRDRVLGFLFRREV